MPIQPSTDALGIYSYGDGSNLRVGTNPAYAISDFLDFYPEFSGVPQIVMQSFVAEANARVQSARFRGSWTRAMAEFIGHYCTLYLQSYVDPSSDSQTIVEAGRLQGVTTSQSVGDVSESVDVSSVVDPAWGDFNLTSFGVRFKTMAKMYGKGGMQIW